MSQNFVLTVTPGLPSFEEPIKRYVERENYGSNMTVYKFSNEATALLAKKQLENEGYVIHLERPDGTTTTTKHDVFYSGIKITK